MSKKSIKLDKPQIKKVVINCGVGRLSQLPQFEDKILPELVKEIAAITGQKPKTVGAKKSIAGFKIRTNQIVGLMVTLRGKRMADFLSRLISIALPRLKDFRGVSPKNIDSHGNLNLGLREQFIFPEISPELSKVNFGLEITMVLDLKKEKNALDFYKALGIPFKK